MTSIGSLPRFMSPCCSLGRIGAEPVGLAGLPGHLLLRLALAVDDVERAALERDDRPPVIRGGAAPAADSA